MVDGEFVLPVIDARRNFAGVCGRWYPFFLELHRFFFFGTSRAVWLAGAPPKRRRVGREERGRAMLLGPASLQRSVWVNLPSTAVTAGDVGAWPYSVGLLV